MKTMIKRIMSIFLIVILLFPISNTWIPISHAVMVPMELLSPDLGHRPQQTPGDDPTHTLPSTPDHSNENESSDEFHYTGISGKVYEQLFISDPASNSNESYINSGSLPTQSKGVPHVIVKAIRQDAEGEYQVTTKSDGTYSFENLDPGTYKLEFYYGKITGNPDAIDVDHSDNVANIRSILKYNGYDFITTKAPDGVNLPRTLSSTTIEREIISSENGCAQVYLLIDCSGSVRNTDIVVGGEQKNRFQMIIESSKQLIDSLLDSSENIYVGLIFFSGTCYRAQSLTNNKEILKAHLDALVRSGWHTGGTNLYDALNKANNSFLVETGRENRHMIIISDGMPTAAGSNVLYVEDLENPTYVENKLNEIRTTTHYRLLNLNYNSDTNRGIHIRAIYITADDDETAYIRPLFEDSVEQFLSIRDGDSFVYEITQNLPQTILSTTEERTYRESIEIEAGEEDADRRNEVDRYFLEREVNDRTYENFYYNQGIAVKPFEQISYDFDSGDYYEYNHNTAMELSEHTYMKVDGGEYTIEAPFSPAITEESYESVEDGVVVSRTRRVYHYNVNYTNRDVELQRRRSFSLDVSSTITGLKIQLSDGTIYSNQTLPLTPENPMPTGPILESMTEELAYGATVEVEYTISIKNHSSLDCHHLDIICYLPRGFGFDSNVPLITSDGTNQSEHWQLCNLNSLYENHFITENTYNKYRDRIAIISTWDNNNEGESGFFIPASGSKEIKVGVTMVASGTDSLDLNYDLAAEILGYRDNGENTHRRMTAVGRENLHSIGETGLFPGNSKTFEKDYTEACSNQLFLGPPFGKQEKVPTYILVIIATSLLALVILIVIHIQNTKNNNKMIPNRN